MPYAIVYCHDKCAIKAIFLLERLIKMTTNKSVLWFQMTKIWFQIKPKLCLRSDILKISFFIPHHLKCGGVLCYTFRCLSVRPCSPFPIDNLSIYSTVFFKFCIHIVIGDEWYEIVNGQNPSIFNGFTALFRIGKMVSGLLFLYCS